MKEKELLNYINFFREKANNGKLIIFVGAGVSRNVEGMPSWKQLIQEMAKSIGYTKCENCSKKTSRCKYRCKFKDDFSPDEFLKIPQHVFNHDKKLYNKILRANIKPVNVNAPLSKAILDLHPAHIITTNYDKLIESCESELRDNYELIIYDKDLLKTQKNQYIIKMHGDISDIKTIVLKEADYLEYSQKHILIEMFVKSLLTDHTILFLGYSLNDYNIKLIISWINYIRAQNKAFDSNTKFGYIALDNKKISDKDVAYFENNNIGVVNLHDMPLVNDIPSELSNEIGKRLYSFLRVTNDASLDRIIGQSLPYDNAISFMSKYNYVDITNMCKLLYLGAHNVEGHDLVMYSDTNYDFLKIYLSNPTNNSKKLKQLMVDAGIQYIQLVSTSIHRHESFSLTDFHKVIKSLYFEKYLSNQYDKLSEDIEKNSNNLFFENSFYRVLIYNYSKETFDDYSQIKFEALSTQDKIRYLFNSSILKSRKTYSYNGKNIEKYIKGIENIQEKGMYNLYLDILDGNCRKLLSIERSVKKLKEHYYSGNYSFVGGGSLGEFYKIQRIAIEQYMFYFNNTLFFNGFSDLKSVLKVYIEAIICTNGLFIEEMSDILGGRTKKVRYEINSLDLDVLTKFISIKDLYTLIQDYKLEYFQADDKTIDFAIKSFENIILSILNKKLFSRFLSAPNILMNSALILIHLRLNEQQKQRVSHSINLLFNDVDFINFFFSVEFPETSTSLKILDQLLSLIPQKNDFEFIKNIIQSSEFKHYYINSNTYKLKNVIKNCVDKEKLTFIQSDISNFILSFEDKDRINVTRLLKALLVDENIMNIHKEFISNHFNQLSSDDIFDFAFDNWVNISKENTRKMIDDAIQMYNHRKTTKIRTSPDYLKAQLDIICILYITDKIKDISSLNEMANENVYLQFLLDSENFDYSQVDFSDYMWENIMRQSHFVDKFIKHKSDLIQSIQRKIEMDAATEFEKKVLYGILLSNGELLKN